MRLRNQHTMPAAMRLPTPNVKDTRIFMTKDLDNLIVVVTGHNGQLGQSIVRQALLRGARVIGIDINKTTDNRGITQVECDITNRASVASAASTVERIYAQCDILINNAGVAVFTPFEARTDEELDFVTSVNLKGTIQITQAFLPLLKKSKSPAIVNIASLYGNLSSDPRIYTDCTRNNSEIYSATKAAIIQLTKYWAVHLASQGIRTNCVSPGGIFNHQGTNFVENYSFRCPLKRMAEADEVAHPILFLASAAASYINGHNLIVDGGYCAW